MSSANYLERSQMMPRANRSLLSFIAFFFFLTPVASLEADSLPWIEHHVYPGDTLETIADNYGIDSKSIRRANELSGNEIPPARPVVLVPREENLLIETLAEVRARKTGNTTADLYLNEEEEPDPPLEAAEENAGMGQALKQAPASLSWPVDGKLFSGFGPRRGRFHCGIDISAPRGTPVHAAAAGTVVRAAYRQGYGRTILIDHGNGTLTRYSHCDTMLCKAGDNIKAGQKIGTVGRTGRTTGPHLHFEVIISGKHQDPEKHLPPKNQ